MRIALITSSACPGDAIGNLVAEKAQFFIDRGDELRVFAEWPSQAHPAVKPYLSAGPLEQLKTIDLEWLKTSDLVITQFGLWYSLLNLLPFLAGGRPRLMVDYHGITPAAMWPLHNRRPLEEGLRRRSIVCTADIILTHSQFTRSELLEGLSLAAERCRLLGHPLDGRFGPAGKPGKLKHRLGLMTEPLLLFVGRVAPNKRLETLVEALARLAKRTPAAHAAVIGANTDLYQVEMRKCLERAQTLGVADRLHFLGHVSTERLIEAYRSADVFVMPSVHEGFCIPVIEAMACGLPVTAARASALPETCADAAALFEPDDSKELADTIARVLDDPAYKHELLQRGLQRAAMADRTIWRREFGDLVDECLQAKRLMQQKTARLTLPAKGCLIDAEQKTALPLVTLTNTGTCPVPREGPGRWVMRADVSPQRPVPAPFLDRGATGNAREVKLPDFLPPGESTLLPFEIDVPSEAGFYQLRLELAEASGSPLCRASLLIKVVHRSTRRSSLPIASLEPLMAEALRLQCLPTEYLEVCDGALATWKRWLKRKLLGNFQHAYVDVLSLQQSAFNQRMVTLVRALVQEQQAAHRLSFRLKEECRRRKTLERRVRVLERMIVKRAHRQEPQEAENLS